MTLYPKLIMDALATVVYPGTKKNLVESGMVADQPAIDGMKVKDIAAARCVEVVTVKTQIKGLLRKFGCTRTKEIVEMIHELGVEHLF